MHFFCTCLAVDSLTDVVLFALPAVTDPIEKPSKRIRELKNGTEKLQVLKSVVDVVKYFYDSSHSHVLEVEVISNISYILVVYGDLGHSCTTMSSICREKCCC